MNPIRLATAAAEAASSAKAAVAAVATNAMSAAAIIGIATAAASMVIAPAALAQTASSYPAKTVRIVVPQAPGGASDALARIIAQRLSERWKQPVIVENKA